MIYDKQFAVSTIVDYAWSAYIGFIIARILVSWTFLERDHPVFDYAIIRFIFKITKAPMEAACTVFPLNSKGRCWGPFVLLVVLFMLKIETVSRLEQYALTL